MKVALFTSVSANIADMAALTMPNKLAYCLRHGYSLIADNRPYDEAVRSTATLCKYLDSFDVLWTLDCDAVITNMATAVHELPCLGPNVTVCEEGIVQWNRVNCGSMVWKNTPATRALIYAIQAAEPDWKNMPCIWQSWIAQPHIMRSFCVAIAPLRSFNSCEWTLPGGGPGDPGTHWQPGDFVYHPCGVFPMAERLSRIAAAMKGVAA